VDTDPQSLPIEIWERFFAGECTPGEEERVRAWAATTVGDPAAADRMREVVRAHPASAAAVPNVDVGAFVGALRKRLALPAPLHEMRPRGARPSVRPWRVSERPIARVVAGLAAAAAIVLAVALPARRVGEASTVFATRRGERSDIRLADGTQVILAPSSRLVVMVGADGARELALTGAGVFRVVHDPRRPFVVRTAHAVTTDIGTIFAVRDYARDTVARVAVREGEVRVSGPRDATGSTIGAGGAVIVGARDADVVVDKSGNVSAFAWADGHPTFQDARLGDVLEEIDRWYDVDVTVADRALAQQRLSTSWSTESATAVLRDLATLVHAHVQWTGRRAVLHADSAAAAP
jgi:transmembrane sensor